LVSATVEIDLMGPLERKLVWTTLRAKSAHGVARRCLVKKIFQEVVLL